MKLFKDKIKLRNNDNILYFKFNKFDLTTFKKNQADSDKFKCYINISAMFFKNRGVVGYLGVVVSLF
jgi:hypothetical protein